MNHGVWIPRRTRGRARASAAAVLTAVLFASPAAAQGLDEGLLWSSPPSSGEQWIPNAVSIGNDGTQVFAHLFNFDTYTKLFSAFEGTGSTEVWTRETDEWSTASSADSASLTDVHVGLHQYYRDTTLQPQGAIVEAFASGSSVPTWRYEMPLTIYNHKISGVRVSEDGATVVAYAHDSLAGKLEVAVFYPDAPGFDPGNPQPARYSQLPDGGGLKGVDMSADGSTLIFGYTSNIRIYDTSLGEVVFNEPVFTTTITGPQAVSGDGRWFAFGVVSGFLAYERTSPGNYVERFFHAMPESGLCTALDLSEDGSTIAAGYTISSGPSVRVQAVDVASQSLMANRAFYGGGSAYDNRVADVSISPNGDYFAAGILGDQNDQTPELVTFRSASSNPLATYDLPGSVVDVDISRDGRRCAAGVRTNHANQGASGGWIECYNVVDRDLALIGTPSAGNNVSFKWRTPGASFAVLLRSRTLAPAPMQLPGVQGSLYLPRDQIVFLPGDISNGIATRNYTVTGAGTAVGSSLYFQGFSGNPRKLTDDMVKLTVLP